MNNIGKLTTLAFCLASTCLVCYAQPLENISNLAAEPIVQTDEDILQTLLASSQPEELDPDNIYRVELIVFSDNYREYQHAEKWSEQLELGYPQQLNPLINAGELLARYKSLNAEIATLESTSLTDSNQNLRLEAEPESEQAVKPQTIQNEATALENIEPDTAMEGEINAVDQAVAEELPLPTLMVPLGQDEAELKQIARTLQRRSRYQLLFHQSWYQSLQSKTEAAAIPISGGQQFHGRNQLEGYITFSRGRFLHVTANLWLIDWQRQPNAHDLPWYMHQPDKFSLPEPPDLQLPAIQALENRLQVLHDIQLETASEDEALHSHFYNAGNISIYRKPDTSSFNSEESARQDQLPGYRPRRVYPLREYRRLKRDEVHYLDHPLFGAIVMISKYEPEKAALQR